MQSLGWYVKRLRAMDAQEIVGRLQHAAVDVVDRVRFPLGLTPKASSIRPGVSAIEYTPGFAMFNETAVDALNAHTPHGLSQLIAEADQVADHKLRFFDMDPCDLGDPMDWQKDHSSGKRGPMRLIQSTNYRDFSVFGDCKLVWEPSRHHHLVTLGRAYRWTGQERYAESCMEHLESWMDANRFGYGMNWRSPLELGIRIINWVAAIDLIRDSQAMTDDRWQRIYHCAYLHVWEVARKYSGGSSANNHLVGELAGVFVACSYFPDFPDAQRLREEALAGLEGWVADFAFEDGCTPEQALGYQFFVLQFLTVVALAGERTGMPVSATYRERLAAMFAFPAELAAGGELPMFGDQDDGYVLYLGEDQYDMNAVLAMGACLLQNPALAAHVRRPAQSALWLYDDAQRELLTTTADTRDAPALTSRLFGESGYALLQSGDSGSDTAISALFDCGPLGLGSLAAHGHADALSVAVRYGGHSLLIDPGTYDYYSHPQWRHYFRTTAAHNTVGVDDEDQSEIQGPFLWGQRANAQRLDWLDDQEQTRIVGSHDGYSKLADPVIHTREVVLDKTARAMRFEDRISANAEHKLTVHFHFAPECQVSVNGQRVIATLDGKRHELQLPEGTSVTQLRGSYEPISGWMSRRYHVKEAADTVSASITATGDITLVSVLSFDV
ncbi:MAG: alginate lyase family protein [Pseudomonadota bacterium]